MRLPEQTARPLNNLVLRLFVWSFVLLGSVATIATARNLQASGGFSLPGREFWRMGPGAGVLFWQVLTILLLFWGGVLLRRFQHQQSAADSASRSAEQEAIRCWELEEELRDSEASLQSLLEGMKGYAFFTLTPEGQALSWNEAAQRLYGYRSDEALGRAFADLCQKEDPPAGRSEQMLGQALREGRSEENCWLVRRDGTPFWAHVTITALSLPQNKRQRLLVMTRDLTDQRKAEDSLRRTRTQYRNLTETARDVVITISPEGIITSLNPAFETITGWPTRDWLGKPFANLVVLENRPRAQEMMSVLAAGNTPPLFELGIQSAFRKVVPVEFTATRQWEQGRSIGWLGIGRDVSERRQTEEILHKTEEQLRQAHKMKAVGQLAGGVAHDFNNLLTIINGYCEILERKFPPTEAVHGLIGEIKKAGHRAAGLTQQLLAFSRKQVLSPKVLDLNPRLADITKMLDRLIGEDIELATQLDPNLCLVTVDPGQMDQVLMNLAVNARDAMPKGGRLTIQTSRTFLSQTDVLTRPEVKPGPYVLLTVSDTGCGMDEHVKSHLFEPFFTTKEPGKGTGLGLATVYGVVTQSLGHVEVSSQPGQGTTFKIYLPQPEEVALPSTFGQAAPTNTSGGAETILLVEDEDGVRDLSRLTLVEKGYTVLVACNGTEAVALLEKHQGQIDLVITDVVMPQMSGAALVKLLRSRFPSVKALFISGYNDSVLSRHGVLATETAYLHKPFGLEELTSRVREILDGKKEN